MKNMIYTSYFAKLNKLPASVVPIAICGRPPTAYRGFRYIKLAPKQSFFLKWKENGDNEAFMRAYKQQLSLLNPAKVVEELRAIANRAENLCLICFEKSEDFCHRHLVAKWLRENGIPCEEYKFEDKIKQELCEQISFIK